MTQFWLSCAALAAIAAAFVLAPLWRYRSGYTDTSRTEVNTRIFRQRLTELEAERTDGRIDDARYQELRAELERALLSDVPAQASLQPGARASGWLVGIVTASVILAACIYYVAVAYRAETAAHIALAARYSALLNSVLRKPDALAEIKPEDLPGFLRLLQTQVARARTVDPDQLLLLGVGFIQTQRLEDAKTALSRARQLAPARNDIAIAYAQALILANDGRIDREAAQLLHAVLRAEPNHQGALMLLGIGAFNSGDYQIAITAWKPLLASVTPGSEAARLLSANIERAEAMLKQESVPKSPGATAAQASIAVTVDLAPDLKARLAPDDTLFVFAKAVQGPPMPLAAVRQAAKDFPVQVVLDDSRAPTPAAKLSDFQNVVVGARISKGGDAVPRTGDLEGQSAPLSLGASPVSVSLIVDRVVP